MSYELNMKYETDFLYAQATGIRTPQTVIAIARDLVAACDEHGYDRALVDVQGMNGTLATTDAYSLGTKYLKEFRRPGRLKVSILDAESNQYRFRFLETVARNQGFNLRIFSNIDEAMGWLREGGVPFVKLL